MQTSRELFDTATHWLEKARIIHTYHTRRIVLAPDWKLEHTAHYFEMSRGYISEALMLVRYEDKIAHAKSRNDAIIILRKLKRDWDLPFRTELPKSE